MIRTLTILCLLATAPAAGPLIVKARPITGTVIEHPDDHESCPDDRISWATWEIVLAMPTITVDGLMMTYLAPGHMRARAADRVVDGGDQTIGYWDDDDQTLSIAVWKAKPASDLSFETVVPATYRVMRISIIDRHGTPCYEAWSGLGRVQP